MSEITPAYRINDPDVVNTPTGLLEPYVTDDTVDLRESEELLRTAEQKSRIGNVCFYSITAFMAASGLWATVSGSDDVKQGVASFGAQILCFVGSFSASVRADKQLDTAHANHIDNINYAKFGY